MSRGLGFGPAMTPRVKQLLTLLGALWFVSLIGTRWMNLEFLQTLFQHSLLHPSTSDPKSVWSGEFWQLGTYMFLHDLGSPFHVFINGLMLWFFAPLFEERWGGIALLKFLFLCGVGAAVFTGIAAWVSPAYFGAPVLGASGAILGLISAFGLIFPNQSIYLWAIVRIQGRYLIPLTLGVDTLMFLTNPEGFAFATHVGGLLTGYLLISGNWRPQVLRDQFRLAKIRAERNHLRVVENDEKWLN